MHRQDVIIRSIDCLLWSQFEEGGEKHCRVSLINRVKTDSLCKQKPLNITDCSFATHRIDDRKQISISPIRVDLYSILGWAYSLEIHHLSLDWYRCYSKTTYLSRERRASTRPIELLELLVKTIAPMQGDVMDFSLFQHNILTSHD